MPRESGMTYQVVVHKPGHGFVVPDIDCLECASKIVKAWKNLGYEAEVQRVYK